MTPRTNVLDKALREEAAQLAAKLEENAQGAAPPPPETPEAHAAANPANAKVTALKLPPRNSVHRWTTGRRRLEVSPLPGYIMYWHRAADVPDAIDAGWEFVDKQEVQLNPFQIGGDSMLGGNTDLGSRVSVIGSASQGERLYLMKLHETYARQDRDTRFRANAGSLRSIFVGERIVDPESSQLVSPDGSTYVKTPYVPLFQRAKVAPQVTGAVVRQ